MVPTRLQISPGLLHVVENRLQLGEWRTAAAEIGAVLAALDDLRAKFALDERSIRDLRARVAEGPGC